MNQTETPLNELRDLWQTDPEAAYQLGIEYQTKGLIKPAELVTLQKQRQRKKKTNGKDLFIIKPFNVWMQEAASIEPKKQLFGTFWTQSELVNFFADTGAGKSILAVQLGNDICAGQSTLKQANEAGPLRGVYFDFELSLKQQEKRNSDKDGTPFEFHQNFLRAELNPFSEVDDSDLEMIIFERIAETVGTFKADFAIIDNISWLHSDTEKAKFAVPLMRELKKLSQKTGLSLMVINHTTKRDESRPIRGNDMAGSKMLMNLADSAFTLGRSAYNPNIRYFKEIKSSRTAEPKFIDDWVLVAELVKTDRLHFRYLTEAKESNYLKAAGQQHLEFKDKQRICAEVLQAHGQNNSQIARIMDVTEGAVRNWLKQRKDENI